MALRPAQLAIRLKRTAGLLRSYAIYWRPGRQRGLKRLYRRFVGQGDLVFDIGAHLGDRSAAFAGLGCRVVALEPQPHLLPWLRRNLARYQAVTVLPQAVGAAHGEAEIAVSPLAPTVSSLAPSWRRQVQASDPGFAGVRWGETARVDVTTLDRLIADYGEPAFCKIDVEGYEAQVLAGLTRPLPALSLEFVTSAEAVARASLDRLAALGNYRGNAVAGEGRSFVFPDWQPLPALKEWLAAGAGGAASGDLYLVRCEG